MTETLESFDKAKLDACIACGYCLPACPTYKLTGDEASSPRGRIALMRMIESGEVAVGDPLALEQSQQCLGCRACEPVCPAGVDYGYLIEQWRDVAWRRKPLRLVVLMTAVRRLSSIRLGAIVSQHARPNVGDGRQYLMMGCFERILFPKVSRAAASLSPDLTVELSQGCCGALHAHNGALSTGEQMARELGSRLPGTIVTTSGGCAAHLASVIGRDRVLEYSEYAEGNQLDLSIQPVRRGGRLARIAIQDSCHLRNGLGVAAGIRSLVERVGTLVDLDTAADCCGAAGSYSLLRPQDAAKVVAPKLVELGSLDVDILVVVNPGCYRQLRTQLKKENSRIEVLHLVELLAEASSGT